MQRVLASHPGKALPGIQSKAKRISRAMLISGLLLSALASIYVVGFEKVPLLHNAFHDLRHATGFPCH